MIELDKIYNIHSKMTKPKFSLGDQIRRKTGGAVHIISDIDSTAYHFQDGAFLLINDQDCYVIYEQQSGFFIVDGNIDRAPINRYMDYGYEHRNDFHEALSCLINLWGSRIGERVDSRHGHLLLRFHDTPGGRPDQAWVPLYLLTPCPRPPYMDHSEPDPIEHDLNAAFGFDWWI